MLQRRLFTNRSKNVNYCDMANIIYLENGASIAKLSTFGAQVLSWLVDGSEVFFQGTIQRRQGIPILFPFADKLENDIYELSGQKLTSHGFARDMEWRILNQESDRVRLGLSYNDLSAEAQSAYPHNFSVEIEYFISDNFLNISLFVQNNGTEDMLIAPGLHPYFPVIHNQKTQLELVNGLGVDVLPDLNWEREMASGKLVSWDGHKVRLMLKNKAVGIQEITEGLKQFQNLVIWSQTPDYPDYDFVCVEQFTRPANGINTDPVIIESGKTWNAAIKFVIEEHLSDN